LNGLILAIDLGKFNSVCCWYDTSTKSATFRQARTTRADLGRDLTRQPVLDVVVTQVERNFSNEADVVLMKAGPGREVLAALENGEADVVLMKAGPGLVCDPGGRPVAVTANSRVNPESSNVRIATRKNRRRTVRDCGIIVDQAHLPAGRGAHEIVEPLSPPVRCSALVRPALVHRPPDWRSLPTPASSPTGAGSSDGSCGNCARATPRASPG